MATYSFIDVNAVVTGPGGSIQLGYGSGAAEEGITIEMIEDKNRMDIGADGSVQHNLHAGNGATCTFHMLKTSQQNQQFSQLYNTQRLSSLLWGKNIITVTNPVSGDTWSGSLAAFVRFPNLGYAKDAAMQDWAFHVGIATGYLGPND